MYKSCSSGLNLDRVKRNGAKRADCVVPGDTGRLADDMAVTHQSSGQLGRWPIY